MCSASYTVDCPCEPVMYQFWLHGDRRMLWEHGWHFPCSSWQNDSATRRFTFLLSGWLLVSQWDSNELKWEAVKTDLVANSCFSILFLLLARQRPQSVCFRRANTGCSARCFSWMLTWNIWEDNFGAWSAVGKTFWDTGGHFLLYCFSKKTIVTKQKEVGEQKLHHFYFSSLVFDLTRVGGRRNEKEQSGWWKGKGLHCVSEAILAIGSASAGVQAESKVNEAVASLMNMMDGPGMGGVLWSVKSGLPRDPLLLWFM